MKTNSFDIYELPQGHQERFSKKISQKQLQSKLIRIACMISIAACLIITFWSIGKINTAYQMAQISLPSEAYYLPQIEKNIQIIKQHHQNHKLTQNALYQLNKMNNNYLDLKKQIFMQGENKQLIYAMITNFETQLHFSKQVIEKIYQNKHSI